LTTAAYADARKLDPSLPADITQANPAQLNSAQTAFTQQNAKYLQGYGIQPTANTLSAAHFIGAKGLSDYQTKRDEQGRPYISPQAQAANGGYEKTAAIINQRMGGQAAPASGAVQRPQQPSTFQGQTNEFGGMEEQPINQQAQPVAPGVNYGLGTGAGNQGIRIPGLTPVNQMPAAQPDATTQAIGKFQTVQNDANGLMQLALDQNTPEHIRERSREQFARVYDQQKKETQAQKELTQLGPRDVADAIQGRSKSGVGDWLQYLLLKHVGLNDLANQKGEELGIGHKWDQAFITNEAGQEVPVQIQTSASGKIIRGALAGTGEELTPEQLQKASGQIMNAANMKTLQTQANQSASSSMDAMRKENQQAQNKGLAPPYTEDQVLQRGRDVYRQTMSVTRPNMGGAPAGAPGAGAPAGVATATGTTPTTTGVLQNWNQKRPGEDIKDFSKRIEMRPEEIESAAQGLVEGRMKPTEFTGRNNDFRRLAIARAAEIDPKYTPQRYEQVQAVVKRYTSGEDHKTLVNTGTAVNHLLQFKEIAAITPGNTNVSSWNTFYQNLNKYGNAPEVKSKEAMAGFVAGELVKAASGAQGSMTERIHLEKQLMAANTPAEVSAIVDNSVKLAHGRYSSLKSSYEGSTGRKDFDAIVGMPREAKEAFAKLEGQDAAKSGGYKDPDKEARYQEYLRKKGTAQ
jgi:hypothetical protein